MNTYTHISKTSPAISQLGNTAEIADPEKIQEGTAAEIARNNPTLTGYLSYRPIGGMVIRGPKIRLGMIWNSARGYISPERFEELYGKA